MNYLSKEQVGAFLIGNGLSNFTVAFDKADGGHRIMTGVLSEPISGELKVNVTMMTEDGYRSFNVGRVVQLSGGTLE